MARFTERPHKIYWLHYMYSLTSAVRIELVLILPRQSFTPTCNVGLEFCIYTTDTYDFQSYRHSSAWSRQLVVIASMENNNSNSSAQHSTTQNHLSIDSDEPTADIRASSRTRPSKRVKLEDESVRDLAGSDTAALHCDVCDLEFTEADDLLLHMRNSPCHEELLYNPERHNIVGQCKHDEHKTENHPWSGIPAHEYPQMLEALQERCHSSHDLQRHNYVLRQYTGKDCNGLIKCTNCRCT